MQDEGGEEVLRGEVVGWGGGVGKVTEMLKDERGGGEIISHYKSREWDTPWREQHRGEHRADEFKSSSSRTFSYIPPALFIPFLPLCTSLINPETP